MVRYYGSEMDSGGADLGTINVTPDVTPAGSEEMTAEERMAQLKSEREGRAIAAAVERAASNPMFDPTVRPDAPDADANYIYYYSWIGGVTTGEWRLQRAPKNSVTEAAYGSRAIGGATQADFTSSVGANSLLVQPQPIKDKQGNITGWSTEGITVGGDTQGDGDTGDKTDGNTEGFKVVNGVLNYNGKPYTGSYNGQNYKDGILVPATSGNNGNNGNAGNTGNTGNINTGNVNTGVMTSSQQDIYSTIVDRLNRYNLGSLAPLIKKLAIEGATEATIMLRLQDEPLYQERFKANQSRINKGLKVLTPSEYLTLEDDYRQVLRAYGLTQFDNDAYVSQFLANDISVSELSNRVVAAVQRVRNADPAVSAMLKNYYGISNNDLVAYVLDPNQQFQKIERQIAASEIGVAAGRQGFNIGVPVAEQLAAQGISQAEAQRGYATIADILPTAEKLSDIYGKTLEGYGLAEGEQEVFNQLASAQRKRQRLVGREVAEFSGQSGVARGSLAQPQQRAQF